MNKGVVKLILGQVCVGKKAVQCRRIPHNMLNQRMHWAKKLKWTNAWKEEVGYSVMMNRSKFGKLPLKFAHVTIFLYTIHMFDRDGSFSAVKPIIDALKVYKGVGVIVDDSNKYVQIEVEQIKVSHRKDEHVEILIKKI